METVAIIILIVEGILLLAILIAVVALIISLKNLIALLTEKIDPAVEAVSKFAQDMNQHTDKNKHGFMANVFGGGIMNKFYTLYRYISVIPDVIRDQKR